MKNILNYSRTGKRRAYDPFGALPLGDGFPTPAYCVYIYNSNYIYIIIYIVIIYNYIYTYN